MESDFGRQEACPFVQCTKLVLACYNELTFRLQLEKEVEEFRLEPKQFSQWLITDELQSPTGLFPAIEAVRRLLTLENFF